MSVVRPPLRGTPAAAALPMKEMPWLFGPQRNLVGVWCEPAHPTQPTVCLLLVNAGVVHRIGLHRINVKIARHMAAQGLPSLRLDLSGLGDSRVAGTAQDFRGQAVADIRAAMDQVERLQGIRRFAIFGICSGAYNGYAAALADPRIVALSMLDGHAFAHWKTPWVRHWKRLQVVSARQLAAALLRRLAAPWRRSAQAAADPAAASPDSDPVVHASREQYAQALQSLADRGVVVHVAMSGSLLDHYSYAGQFADVFGRERFAAHVVCDHLPQVDHSVTLLAGQRELIDRLDRWVARLRAVRPAAVQGGGAEG